QVPEGLSLWFADLPDSDRTWHGPVPITTPARTVNDSAAAAVSPEFVHQAIEAGLRRGLFTRDDVTPATLA
ncbi:MAG: hypothetical protein ACI9K2_006900, partial [Myxococcota bacterium]